MESILFAHQEKYPKMEALDYYKLIYQQLFGNGHYVKNEAESLERLVSEYREFGRIQGQRFSEPIGNGYVRVHLGAMSEELLPILNNLFIRTTNRKTGTLELLEERLHHVVKLAEEGKLTISPRELEDTFTSLKERNYPAVSHSKTYRESYSPHYRVIDASYLDFFPVLEYLLGLKQSGEPQIIAIDGRCGSGKTTLATLIKEIMDCNVFHMDDFFLPKEMKTKERLSEPGGNVHYERVLEEVILPLTREREVKLVPFNCSINDVERLKVVPYKKINIIEGVYALHPALKDYYSHKVFITVDRETQIQRIRDRGQEAKLHRFIKEWIPLEENYFEALAIEEKADTVINTSVQ